MHLSLFESEGSPHFLVYLENTGIMGAKQRAQNRGKKAAKGSMKGSPMSQKQLNQSISGMINLCGEATYS